MANRTKRLPSNVDGDFYVDMTCIDCGVCRWMAPDFFDRVRKQSRIYRQPRHPWDIRAAELALLACPTASIGTHSRHDLKPAAAEFPLLIEDGVYHVGYHSEATFGATSYLIQRPGGNILVDCPRFTAPLVRKLEELGGVRYLFLTHKDDVAGHERFRAHFGCDRILHKGDACDRIDNVEMWLEGRRPVRLDEDVVLIPTPGHTDGSACLTYKNKFLFTGDTLAWSPKLGHIYAFYRHCWGDWDVLKHTVEGLCLLPFEWLLPGHGMRCHFPREEMRAQMRRCLLWMDDVQNADVTRRPPRRVSSGASDRDPSAE